MSPSGEGLRERRRRQTRQEIHTATLRLAREHGFDKVTIEMISSEAGVSPRTFFNYFPNKEAAAVFGPQDLSPGPTAEFVAAGPARPGEVLRDLTGLLLRELAGNPPLRRDMHDVFALAHEHPGVLAAMLAQFDAFGETVAATVAERMGRRPGDEVPNLIAAVALTAVRSGLERWSRDEPADSEDSPVPYVERSVNLLHTLLAS
ncbi:TetR family transcriptional regulator [Streptomyces glaucosporus]|uniref:TetR family transcriptional regulator n=1 Tax=Streptomyces glaucosporus TaxID=284044 RepID=A0ABP5VVD9_9ACTN